MRGEVRGVGGGGRERVWAGLREERACVCGRMASGERADVRKGGCSRKGSVGYLHDDCRVSPLVQHLLPLRDSGCDDLGGVVQATHRVLGDDSIL